MLEPLHGAQQAQVALLDQVEQRDAPVGVALGDADDQAQVGLGQRRPRRRAVLDQRLPAAAERRAERRQRRRHGRLLGPGGVIVQPGGQRAGQGVQEVELGQAVAQVGLQPAVAQAVARLDGGDGGGVEAADGDDGREELGAARARRRPAGDRRVQVGERRPAAAQPVIQRQAEPDRRRRAARLGAEGDGEARQAGPARDRLREAHLVGGGEERRPADLAQVEADRVIERDAEQGVVLARVGRVGPAGGAARRAGDLAAETDQAAVGGVDLGDRLGDRPGRRPGHGDAHTGRLPRAGAARRQRLAIEHVPPPAADRRRPDRRRAGVGRPRPYLRTPGRAACDATAIVSRPSPAARRVRRPDRAIPKVAGSGSARPRLCGERVAPRAPRLYSWPRRLGDRIGHS